MLIKVEIAGVSPLLLNRFTEAAQEKSGNATSAVHSGKKGTPREQSEPKLYRDSNGAPVLPGPNLFRAIVDAGSFIKSGKSKVTTMRSSLVPAGVALMELELPITPGKWEPDSRAVVIPATGGRIMCHRPRFDQWSVKFSLDIDQTLFADTLVRELVDLAGQRIGVGDFRPARKGPFGRFKVTNWKVDKKS